MSGPTMKILYGPPGTGKTWKAAREAVKAVEPDRYEAILAGPDPDQGLMKLHGDLVADGRILWVTFHPSYSYEDFIEGYRPLVDDSGQLAYRVVDGPFKALCQRAGFKSDLQIGDQLTDGGGRPAGTVVGKDAGGWIVQVQTDRSDAVAPKIDKYVPRYVVNRILENGFDPNIFSIAGKSLLPLSNYGIDPAEPDVPAPQSGETSDSRLGSTIRKIVAARTGMFSSSDLSNASHIGSVVRRITQLRSQSASTRTPVVIVIDEINRAEPSRVFGELLTLLEINKREGMEEEKKIALPYSKELFSVPQEVSVIGTMNTVDRSLTALDFAMRRRFEFELVSPEPDLVSNNMAGVDVQALLIRLNARIKLLLGSGYEFGHAFFMESRISSVQKSEHWLGLADGELRALAHILRANIFPTLGEYLHDDWVKVRAVAGQAQTPTKLESLFEKKLSDATFLDRLSDDYEIAEVRPGSYASWWDPKSNTWDSDRFKAFIIALAAGL